MSARFLEITAAEYHADPCEQPSLSSSIATELIQRSPLHAWQLHPKLGATQRESTTALDNGTLVHALMLGKGEEQIAVLDVDHFRTKAAQEQRDAAIAAGKCVIKAADYDAAQDVVKALRARLDKLGIAFEGASEEKIEWTEDWPEDGPILCRAMLDHLVVKFSSVTEATIYDLKTIRSGAMPFVQRQIHEYGYDIQEAAYRRAVGAISPEAQGRIDFVFLFVETDPPYDVTPVRLTGMWSSIGALKWERACTAWSRCLKHNFWPGYVDGITQIEPPPWALAG